MIVRSPGQFHQPQGTQSLQVYHCRTSLHESFQVVQNHFAPPSAMGQPFKQKHRVLLFIAGCCGDCNPDLFFAMMRTVAALTLTLLALRADAFTQQQLDWVWPKQHVECSVGQRHLAADQPLWRRSSDLGIQHCLLHVSTSLRLFVKPVLDSAYSGWSSEYQFRKRLCHC